jgi:hypothetical protein
MLRLIESNKLNASNSCIVIYYPLSLHVVEDNHIKIMIRVMLFDFLPHTIPKDTILFLYVEVSQIFQFWKRRSLFYVRKSYSTSIRLQILP